MPIVLRLLKLFGWWTVVEERTCRVYVLFGNVIAVLDEPGLHFLPAHRNGYAFLVHWLGKCHVLDMRLDQEYLRSQPVNSEEGAPMGIGIWYEMFISRPGGLPLQERRPARVAARERLATPPCAASATCPWRRCWRTATR